VDDRNGTKQKLTPPLFRAAADEARKLGFRSVAHVFDLADAKSSSRQASRASPTWFGISW
jgi:hypothetical protein